MVTEKDGKRIASSFAVCAEAVRDNHLDTGVARAVQLLGSFRVTRKLARRKFAVADVQETSIETSEQLAEYSSSLAQLVPAEGANVESPKMEIELRVDDVEAT